MDSLIQTIKRLHDVHCLLGNIQSPAREDSGDSNIYNDVNSPMALGNWLPQIVVVGSQGSGKSSIIEGLVGRSFLPKGSGGTTRRPLIVQFVYCTKKEIIRMAAESANPKLEAWGVFQHKPDRRFYRFDDIRQEILVETNRVVGERNGISSEPMYLKIYSTSVNFTLVDLPGLVKISMGDQSNELEHKVRSIVLKYMSVPHSIILTVVTANTDLATSECLELARQVDPEGFRTLMVVTKLDLMDAGVDATEILSGNILNMRLGIVGVVNMAHKCIQQGLSMSHALDEEANFFKIRYPKIASKHGLLSLSRVVQNLLLDNIKQTLPDLRRRVMNKINRLQLILASYGSPIEDKGQTLLQLINEFSSNYCSLIVGNFNDIGTGELCCGARIAYIFQESFGNALDSIDPLAGLTRSAMLTAIRNASGTRPGLFVPEVSFELLVKKQIEKLEEPSIQCANLVHEELENLVQVRSQKCSALLKRFPNLHKKIVKASLEIVKAQLPVTHGMIKQTVAIQLAYINTNHPDFVREVHASSYWDCNDDEGKKDSATSLAATYYEQQDAVAKSTTRFVEVRESSESLQARSSSPKMYQGSSLGLHQERRQGFECTHLDKENQDSLVIEHLIKAYFNIVRKTVQDHVPKIIMHCLVNHVTENLQHQLVCKLYHPDLIDDLLSESEDVSSFRVDIEKRIICLKKAADILLDLEDMRASWSFEHETNIKALIR